LIAQAEPDKHMNGNQRSELIALAWDDRTSFKMIQDQMGIPEKDDIKMVRKNLKPASIRLWRKRVSGRTTKHTNRSGY
jgi:uncharacterized protein (TIGR03643 family)